MATVPSVASVNGVVGNNAAEGEAATWAPRVHGLNVEAQRSIRRGIASVLGVPTEWLSTDGEGLPEWWLRLSYPWTWRWRMQSTQNTMEARIEAYVVSSIPTRRWSFCLRQLLRFKHQKDGSLWRKEHSVAWREAEFERPSKRPQAFAWKGQGAALSVTEGSGGAPLACFLRCNTSKWEVLAASRQ